MPTEHLVGVGAGPPDASFLLYQDVTFDIEAFDASLQAELLH